MMKQFWLFVILAVANGTVEAAAAPRVAIVNLSKGLEESIALAETMLSQQNDVAIVERTQVAKAISEQSLAKTGMINAADAIKTGQILSADVLASIESDLSDDSRGASIVVFDCATGVRLCDSALSGSGEKLAQELVNSIKTSLDKCAGSTMPVKTVCLQTVRNADLPREFDVVCHAAAQILMRRLSASPTLVTLERNRLEQVTRERRLTGVESPLLASMLTIELQISQAGGDACDVLAIVSDRSGKRMTVRAVRVQARRADQLASAILEPLLKALGAASPGAMGDDERLAEARRFVREAVLQWRLGEINQGVESAQAAYALSPTDRRAAAARAFGMCMQGVSLICEGNVSNSAHRYSLAMKVGYRLGRSGALPEDDVTRSLTLVRQASEELIAMGVCPAPRGPVRASIGDPWKTLLDEEPLVRDLQCLIREYLGQLRYEVYGSKSAYTQKIFMKLTPAQHDLYREIRQNFRRQRMEIELPTARALVNDRESLQNHVPYLDDILMDARYVWSNNADEWTADWAAMIPEWVDMTLKVWGAELPPESLSRGRLPHSPMQPATRPTTRPATRPATRPSVTYSPRPSMRPTTGPTTGPTTRYFVSPRVVFPKVLEPHYSADWAGMNTFYQWPETQKSVDQLAQAYAPLSRFPYERQQHLAKSFKEQAATFEARAKPAPVITNRPADAPPRPQRNLRGATPVAGDPVPVAAAVGPGTLWPDSMVLIDVVSNNNEDTGFSDQQSLAYPLVDAAGKFVYVVQKNATGQSWSLDLLRFDLTNGKGGPFSSFKGDRAASKAPFFNYVESNGISANLTDKYYLLCCKSQIILYPLAGGQPQSIDAKDSRLPAGHFHSAAVMDDVVYCGAGQGFMFAYDLKTGSRRTLASSRRLAGATQPDGDLASVTSSPFDDDAPLFLSYIKADSERKRLIFLISNPAWDDKKSGWWSYEPASGKFTQLAGYHMRSSNTSRDATWARSTSPNRIFFGFPGLSSTVLDLPSDKVTFLPPVPQQMSSGRGRVDVNDVLGKPLLENNGWIWGRFGRYRIVETEKDGRKSKTTELQSFDSLRAGPRQWGNWPPFLAPVDENRIVVGDSKGVWLLKIPADDPVAMSKLIQPPRPMNASVEPVGVPPMGKSLPWSDVRVLYDTIRGVNVGSKVSLMRGPIVWGDDVFVLAAGEGGTILVRYRLSDGTRTELGKANIDLALSARGPAETLAQNDGALFTTDGQFYYTTRDSHIVHAIPLDGGKARSISFRFGKYSWVRELAAVDGKLFVGLTVTEKDQADGSRGEIVTKLVRYDLATSTMEELNIPARATFGIAGRPREPGLKLRLLRADPARHRVVFFVNQHPLTDESIDGLWACDVAGAPARLKPFDIWPRTGVRVGEGVFDKAGPVRGNNWIVVCPNGAILLDLSTLDFQRIWQVEPAGVPLDASFDFRWPMDVAGGYVWDEGFHRAKLDGSVYQALPALWPMDFKNYGINLKLVEARVDQTEMLIADNCGFWILTLRQQGQ